MCVGAPKAPKASDVKVPVIPERQPLKLPDGGATAARTEDTANRRRGMAFMILTQPGGILGVPATGSLGGGSA